MRKKSIEKISDQRYRVFAQVNGRRRSKIVEGSERAARRELERMRVLMSGAEYVDPATAPTVREAWDAFLEQQNEKVLGQKGLKEGEWKNKERHGRQFCEVKINGVLVGNMRTTSVSADLFEEEILAKLSLGRSAPTIHKLVTNIGQAFGYFVRKKWAAINPTSGVSVSQKGHKKPHRRITPAEMELVIHYAPIKYRLIIETAAYTGMRQGELRALKWDAIDWEDGLIKINCAVEHTTEKLGEPKTEAGERFIEIEEWLLNELREWKLRQPLKQRLHNLIFPNENGEIAGAWGWRENGLKAACKKAGVRPMTFRDLRNFYVSVLVFNTQLTEATITEFVGHTDFNFTKKQYAKWFKDRDRSEDIKAQLRTVFGRG